MRCRICNTKLTNTKSVSNGIGPECAANYQRFVSSSDGIAAAVAEFETSTDPQIQRQIKLVHRAVGDGRISLAAFFLDMARKYAQESLASPGLVAVGEPSLI
jgi:uncharacterized protein DUF6011